MKAAVLHNFGSAPRYEEFATPVPTANEVLIEVKAVALENIDRAMAQGTHFASHQFLPQLPAIVGFDGIGRLPDGTLVGFGGTQAPYGAMAEKTVVSKLYTVPIPTDVDAVTAAALPAAALTSLFPLRWSAKLQPGETVLVNGATGVAGKLAVQIAKHLGAGRVIGTGRNPVSLQQVCALGADVVIDLTQPTAQVSAAFQKEAGDGYDIVLDYLWGQPSELLIKTLVPHTLGVARHRTRWIQIGEMAGPTLTLSADALRTSGLELYGAGAGLSAAAMAEGTAQVWQMISKKQLQIDIETVPLQDIEQVWQRTEFQGKRIVVIP